MPQLAVLARNFLNSLGLASVALLITARYTRKNPGCWLARFLSLSRYFERRTVSGLPQSLDCTLKRIQRDHGSRRAKCIDREKSTAIAPDDTTVWSPMQPRGTGHITPPSAAAIFMVPPSAKVIQRAFLYFRRSVQDNTCSPSAVLLSRFSTA